ncbi:MAG: twin-arginine translocation signal protein [Enterovirga sp.]|jgi:TRAP-type C4-dicarboxylate transport system substrate-binding protein|nr:twin-arginine translocation signal protein [Enterovirga sp.]
MGRAWLRVGYAVAAIAASGLVGGVFGEARAQADRPMTWKAVSNTRNSKQFTDKWPWIAQELSRQTGGKISLEVSSFPELGLTGQELIRILNANLMDMAEVVTGYVSGDVPLMEGVQLPGVFKDYDQARRAYEAWSTAVVEPRERVIGGKPIASFAFSSQYLWSKFPMNSLEDLKGKKVRIFSKGQADFFNALGAEPVSIPLAEIYTALERGTVDAVVTGPESGAGLRLWEVLGYVTDLQLGPGAGFVVVSRKTWDKLSPEFRKVVEAMQPRMNELGWSLGADDTKAGLDLSIEKGLKATIPGKPEWQAQITKVAREVVVANWVKRAGPDASKAFNGTLSPIVGFSVP